MKTAELIAAIEAERGTLGDMITDDAIEAIRDGARGGRHSRAIDALSYDVALYRAAVKEWNAGCPAFAPSASTANPSSR